MGATTRVVLSPTPPVLCLSADRSLKRDKSRVLPECAMAPVSAAVSASLMPLRYIAISSAVI